MIFLRISFFCILLLHYSLAQSNYVIDSLQKLIVEDKEDTTKVIHLNELCWAYQQKSNFDSAMFFGNQALQLANNLKFQKGIAGAYNNVAIIYHLRGNYDLALEKHFKALKIRENENDLKGVSGSLNNIGLVYKKQDNYELAIKFHTLSLDIRKKINDIKGMCESYNNIGQIYKDQKKYDLALKYFFHALEYFEQVQDTHSIIILRGNIASIYNESGNYDSSLVSYQIALKLSIKTDYLQGIGTYYLGIGEVLLNKNIYDIAVFNIEKGQKIIDSLGIRYLLQLAYKLQSEAYKKKGDYIKALEFYQLYKNVSDSLFNAEKTKIIYELQTQYETEKKQQEIDRQTTIIEKRNYQILAIASILFLLATIAAITIILLRIRAKRKFIEMQQKLLRTQMNPHFIFNALTSIQGNVLEKQPEEAADYISKFAALMRLILNSSGEEYIPLTTEIRTLNYYLELQQLRYDNVFEFSIHVLPSYIFNSTGNLENASLSPLQRSQKSVEAILIPPMLAQPFIENAIEHGILKKCQKGFIEVTFDIRENFIFFSVENWCETHTPKITPTFKRVNPALISIGSQRVSEEHKPKAIAITKERLYYLNKGKKEKIDFEFTQKEKTRVRFKIPLLSHH